MIQRTQKDVLKTVQERFWEKVKTAHQDVCWEWQTSIHRDGYGQFSYRGRNVKTHRMSAYLAGIIKQLDGTVCPVVGTVGDEDL